MVIDSRDAAREVDATPFERAESPPEPLLVRVAVGLLLLVFLPPFALAFLAALTLTVVLLPLALVHAFSCSRLGAVPHEARASPSRRGEGRDTPRA